MVELKEMGYSPRIGNFPIEERNMSTIREVKPTRTLMGKLPHGCDLDADICHVLTGVPMPGVSKIDERHCPVFGMLVHTSTPLAKGALGGFDSNNLKKSPLAPLCQRGVTSGSVFRIK